jgi:hypothetical protein
MNELGEIRKEKCIVADKVLETTNAEKGWRAGTTSRCVGF